MSMFNDIESETKRNEELCNHNAKIVAEYAQQFPRGTWSFLGSGSEKNLVQHL